VLQQVAVNFLKLNSSYAPYPRGKKATPHTFISASTTRIAFHDGFVWETNKAKTVVVEKGLTIYNEIQWEKRRGAASSHETTSMVV
jgi:hypothetical protein